MSAPVAPRGGVFCRAGFQAQNVLPAFATHTYCTDDVMRSQTLTIDVNHYPTIEPVHDIRFQRAISNVRRWHGLLPGSRSPYKIVCRGFREQV